MSAAQGPEAVVAPPSLVMEQCSPPSEATAVLQEGWVLQQTPPSQAQAVAQLGYVQGACAAILRRKWQ